MKRWFVCRTCTRSPCMNHTPECSTSASRRLAPSDSFTIPHQWTKMYPRSECRITTTLRRRALKCGLFLINGLVKKVLINAADLPELTSGNALQVELYAAKFRSEGTG